MQLGCVKESIMVFNCQDEIPLDDEIEDHHT